MYRHISGATSESRPFRVRLPDFTTRTGEAVTDEILAEAGWSLVAEQAEVIVEPQVEVVVDQVELVASGS
jgi:hypothetical protein